jgi:hypothetical protein
MNKNQKAKIKNRISPTIRQIRNRNDPKVKLNIWIKNLQNQPKI